MERYVAPAIRLDDEARRRFDTWVNTRLRAELEEPGKHLRTYR